MMTPEEIARLEDGLRQRADGLLEIRKQLVERSTSEADERAAFALAVNAISKRMDRGSVDSPYAYADGYCDALGLDREGVMRAVRGTR